MYIVVRGQLQIAFHAGTGVFGSLTFIAMRQQHNQSAEQSPLVFARCDELIDDDLRTVGKVAELRLPQNQGLRIIAAVTVLETQDPSFGKDGVIDFESRLIRG